jgi:DeoR family transcriptional regulator, aga operon transcriptional repressor
MMDVTRVAVAVCDFSRFARRSLSSIAPLSAVHHLITDRGIPKPDVAAQKKTGIQLTLV